MKNKNLDNESFQYEHVFKLILDIFRFDEKQYGDFVRDTLKIMLELEKNGETIVDVDARKILFDLLEDGWPDEHLKVLEDLELLNLLDSPFMFSNRKLSLAKWSRKIDRVIGSFLKRIDKKILINKKNKNYENKLNQICDIFKSSNIVFLQGGPGTGKTTLIIKFILNQLIYDNYLNIGIAAPTGKATSRLKESLNKQNNVSFGKITDQIELQTLHRWIFNSKQRSINLKFKLKELDIFIIDEMSMVNIDLVELVLGLLAKDCKIILVGDKNQLSPVKNCSIWNYLFEYSENSLIKACIVNLTKTFRNSGDIELISNLIFNNQKFSFYKKMRELEIYNKSKEVKIYKSKKKYIPQNLLNLINNYLDRLELLTSKISNNKFIFKDDFSELVKNENLLLNKLFLELQSQMILCEKNSGIWSVDYVNEIILGQKEPYDLMLIREGLPIMCTKNNNELGISNGDIGILLGKNDQRKYLFRKFNENNEQVFALIDPLTLENVIPAIAITIHKSQGSESEKVSILWNQRSQLNKYNKDNEDNKEENENIFFRDDYEKRLLYTAITRAKNFLDIYCLS